MGPSFENKGLSGLEKKVIEKGLCTLCGACLSLCPYLRSWEGRIVKLDDCDLRDGRCFACCPRAELNLESIHHHVFQDRCSNFEMGVVRRVMMARSTDSKIMERGQNGGVVSGLISFALEKRMIDAALLTRRGEDLLPEGYVARDRGEVLACAGSSYVAGYTLEALNREPWKDHERIGIVGLPCHVQASAKMRAYSSQKSGDVRRVELVVGLFCTWALSYSPFLKFIKERVQGAPILGMDISPPPERVMRVRAGGQVLEIPVEEIRKFVRPGCSVCLDLTSELADVSVGTVEGVDGWNTVIVRTERGEKLLRIAEEEGIIETLPFPESNLKHLKEASIQKKRRAIAALSERGEFEEGYVMIPPGWANKILGSNERLSS